MGKRIKAADKLFEVVDMILNENDSIDPTWPRAGMLPSEWRAPLVKAANEYWLASKRKSHG